MFNDRRFRAAPFALAVLCFVLPFLRFSCSLHPSTGWNISGAQLVSGGQIETPGFGSGKVEKHTFGPEPLAVAALLLALIGVGSSIPTGLGFRVTSAVCGGGGALSLLTLKSRLDSEVIREGQGFILVDQQFGFWAVVLLLLAGAVLHGFSAWSAKNAPGP